MGSGIEQALKALISNFEFIGHHGVLLSPVLVAPQGHLSHLLWTDCDWPFGFQTLGLSQFFPNYHIRIWP
jgi:hypothetical protein